MFLMSCDTSRNCICNKLCATHNVTRCSIAIVSDVVAMIDTNTSMYEFNDITHLHLVMLLLPVCLFYIIIL